MFQEMVDHLKEVVVEQLFKGRMVREEAAPVRVASAAPPRWRESRGGDSAGAARPASRVEPRTAAGEKVGRNDPCPCGSGKKYKKCCLLKGG
jgi:preprotein translocase subunit SecA